MTYSYSLIEHAEENGTRRERIGLKGFDCSVTLRTPYSKRYDLASDLILNSRLWPFHAASAAPVATSCEITTDGLQEGGDASTTSMVFEDALVTVNYSHEQKNLSVEEIEPTIEFRTLDHRQFRWSSGDLLNSSEAPGRQIRGFNFCKTFYFVTSLPTTIGSLVGHVNLLSHTAPILGLTFAPETLLYAPPSINRTITIGNGADLWTVKTKFSYKPTGWNKYWRARTETYEEIMHYDSGLPYKNFPLGPFSSLFALPQAI